MKKNRLPKDFILDNRHVPFSVYPFVEADTAAFSMFLLMDVDRLGIPREGENGFVTYGDAIKKQKEIHGNKKLGLLLPKNVNDLIFACLDSERYKEVRFYNLYNKVDNVTQSSFVMADIGNNITIVVFGGTDDTIVGWKEDLDLLLSHQVECLNNALDYVNRNCRDKDKKYIFIGHSKGGMMACHCMFNANKDIKDRILNVYDLDGPGFTKEYLEEHLDDPILDRFNLICPRDSFVGRLFFQPKYVTVIKSIDHLLMQHNPTGWVVDKDHFLRCKGFSKRGTVRAVMAYDYMNNLSDEEKKNFVNGLTKIAKSGNVKTLSKLILNPFKIFHTAVNLPHAEKKEVFSMPFKLIKSKISARKRIKERKKHAK